MEIEKILGDIESNVISFNKTILEDYKRLNREIELKESLTIEKIKELVDVEKTLKKTQEDVDKIKKDIDEKEKKLISAIEKFNIKNESIDRLINENKEINQNIKIANSELSKIEEKIESESKKLNSIRDYIKLEDEIITRKTGEIDSLNSKLETFKKENESTIVEFNNLKKEKELLEKELVNDREFIKERMSFIEEKEKELDIRQKTIDVLANRYIKLFGDKDISVKI